MKSHFLKIVALAGILSLACTTKVSEWVMLNSEPNQYTLVYLHKDQESDKVKSQNNQITKDISSGNIHFRSVVKADAIQPYYALYYENRLFSRYDDPEQLKKLLTSPLRDKIAAELKAGKLCVMVYLLSGNKEKDDMGLNALKKTIGTSPFGKIIPVIELSRNNAEEKHFISLLLNVESDLKNIKEPMLFGVFARFKALEPLVAGGITEENINLMINFLTADCSCLIKDDLPGTDILYTNDWGSPSVALVNAILDANPSLIHQ
jgi:hypothetical protein